MKEFVKECAGVFGPPLLGVIAVLLVLAVALAVRACDEDREPEYVVIALEDIRICGYVEHAEREGDYWEIELRGGAKYKAPKECVIFCPDPFAVEAQT